MKYIDADLLRHEVKRLEKAARISILNCADSVSRKFHEGKEFAYQTVCVLIDSLQQEQPEVDLEKEIERFLESEESTSYTNAGGYVVAFKDTVKIARHFYELGRKQVLKEIYDGKTKPVDKITAAWLDDKEEDK